MNRLILALCLVAPAAFSMDVEWTHMTGQYPVECAPLCCMGETGSRFLLAPNRQGQVMMWALPEGGTGPDNVVAQLPEGFWSSTPATFAVDGAARYVFCSGEGLVVALDIYFQKIWEYALGANVKYGAGIPVLVQNDDATRLFLSDESGQITCLDQDGKLVWKKAMGTGPCSVPVQKIDSDILVAAGTALHRFTAQGDLVWSKELGAPITARPEVMPFDNGNVIVCGMGDTISATTPSGELLWTSPADDEIVSLAYLPRKDDGLVLCRSLWGNLHAFDQNGHRMWAHTMRTKSRAVPLIVDIDKDGDMEIILAGYNQHAYTLDQDGRLIDDLHVCGAVNGSPVETGGGIAVVTAALMAQRITFAPPNSPYGEMPAPTDIAITAKGDAAVINNPAGGLIAAHAEYTDAGGARWIQGTMTARSAFELPLSGKAADGKTKISVRDPAGNTLRQEELAADTTDPTASDAVCAWPTSAYGMFDNDMLAPSYDDLDRKSVAVENLYVGETDQGACIVRSDLEQPCRAQIDLQYPKTSDGAAFAGPIRLYEVVATNTVNGEMAQDALVELGDARLLQLPSKRAAKLWIGVNADNAAPGDYIGKLIVKPLVKDLKPIPLEFRINVVNLTIKRPFPLTLCTWDYIPNKWFPSQTARVLDGMAAHGVNVFPRSNCIPKCSVDAAGAVSLDFASLDEELARLEGRGQLLLQLGRPPLEFAAAQDADAKHRAELDYLHQLRDHLKSRGRDYGDYAFYPVDEPGLNFGNTVDALVEAATLFREADPQFRIYTDPVPTISRADFDRIEPLIDVWCPNMRLVSNLLAGDPRITRIMDSGKPVWSYECVAQVKSISPLRYNRAAAWRARNFGLDGIGFWTFSTTEVNHWMPPEKGIEEYALVYPGAMPVPSVRWEAVRDGLEDIAAVALLEQTIDARKDSPAATALIDEAKRTLRIAQTDIMELSDQAFVESRDYLRQGDRQIPHTATDARMYQHLRAKIAELTLALGAQR